MHFSQVRYWEDVPQTPKSRTKNRQPWTKERPRSQSQKPKPKKQETRRDSQIQFQPFALNKETPWVPSTPNSRLAPAKAARVPGEEAQKGGTKTQGKGSQEPENEEDNMKLCAQALIEGDVPESLKEALKKWSQKDKEVTHSDLYKLKRLKTQYAKQKEEVATLDKRLTDFKKLMRENWAAQMELYATQKAEAMEQLKDLKEKLQAQQKAVTERASNVEELSEEEDLQEEKEEEMPWDVEEEEEKMDEDGETSPRKKRGALFPFGNPPKVQRT